MSTLDKQAAEQAVLPKFIASVRKSIVSPNLKKFEDEDEKLLLDLATSDAWAVFEKFVGEFLKSLEVITEKKVALSGINIEEIGYRYMITNQIRGALETVLGFVDKYALKAKMDVEEAKNEKKST